MDLIKIEKHFKALMEEGLKSDLTDPNLTGTPGRIARMYAELFLGEDKEFEGLTTFPNVENYDQIVLLDNIHFVSSCSHHLLPFAGQAWVAYIPDKYLLGASKPARVIKHYGARLQLQENLCEQVINYIDEQLKPKGLFVLLRAVHGCMAHRGVNQYDGAGMMTSSIRGVFKTEPSVKAEVLDLIKMSISMK